MYIYANNSMDFDNSHIDWVGYCHSFRISNVLIFDDPIAMETNLWGKFSEKNEKK